MKFLHPQNISKKIIAGTNFFLFPVSLLLLLTLAVWWFILHRNQIDEIYSQKLTILDLKAKSIATELSLQKNFPFLDTHESEHFLLISKAEFENQKKNFAIFYSLSPQWDQYYLVLNPMVYDEIADKKIRRIFMISGEGFLLILLLLVPIFMLYRLMMTEKIARQESESFFRMVSHELKTPVTALQALLDTLLQRDLEKESVKEFALLGLQENRRLRAMIENMLYLQKMDMDVFEGKPALLALDEHLQKYVERRNHLFPAQKIVFENESQNTCLSFFDANLLRHVLENLIDNAFKYSQDSQPVKVLLKTEEAHAAVYIVDNGEGIDEKDIGNIFKKFYRLEDGKERAAGIGMGLFIVQKLVGRMQGHVEVLSRGKGKGSTFIIRLKLGESNT